LGPTVCELLVAQPEENAADGDHLALAGERTARRTTGQRAHELVVAPHANDTDEQSLYEWTHCFLFLI
jgi:hypothetical protein